MSFKSIIDIDVNDEKFQGFLKQFDEFLSKTEAVPEPFRDMEKRIGKTRSEVAKLGSEMEKRMKAAGKTTHGVAGGFEHINKEIKRMPNGMHRASAAFKSFGHEAKRVGNVLNGVAGFALKFTPIGLALEAIGGAASLFGLGDLAGDAMTRMRTAKSMGMRPGSVSAIEAVMRPVLPNAEGALASFSAAYTSPQGMAALRRVFGGNSFQGERKSTAFFQMLQKAQQFAKSTPTDLLGPMASARGFTQAGLSVADLRVLKHTSASSLALLEQEAAADRAKLSFSRKTAKDWEKLDVQLREAGIQIGTVLIKDLAALGPSIARLTRTIVNDISSPFFQQKLKAFAHWVAQGADALEHWLKSPAFKTDMADFESGFDKIVKKLPTFAEALTDASNAIIAIWRALHPYAPDAVAPPHATAPKKYQAALHAARNATNRTQFDKIMLNGYIANAAKKTGVPAKFLHNQIMAESGGNPRAVSPKGAIGVAQFMPPTWKQWGHGSIWNPKRQIDAAARYDAWLKRQTGSWKGAAIAYNEGIGNYDAGVRASGVHQYAKALLEGITKHVGDHVHVHVHVHNGAANPASNLAMQIHGAAR